MRFLSVGDRAPDFKLPSNLGVDISLSEYIKGKWLILAFYPEDDTIVCSKELCSYSSTLEEFKNLGVDVLGINTDSVESHKKFAESKRIDFPLLSDDKGIVSKKYNALYPIVNKSKRAIYIIDKNGIIRYKSFELIPVTYKKPQALLKKLRELEAK